MAPNYRATTQTRRGNRSGYPEHDDFEGLPVRQWREEWMHITPPSAPETTPQNDKWAVELPYGMPKDFQLLPLHSQELLRAARSGQMNKRPVQEEEDNEAEASEKAAAAKKVTTVPAGMRVRQWKQVPRAVEGSTVSHLAKRHKSTITLTSKAALSQPAGPTVTRATVRRIDAAGNPYEQTVTLAEGERVDGEIISTSVVPVPSAADSNGLLQQQTPQRRRPPPPKRKKGPGRGRKKGKLPLPPTSNPASNGTDGEGAAAAGSGAVGPDGVKTEGDGDDTANNDSEAADNSALPSDEEGDDDGEDGEDGDEDGEEGDGDDAGDDEHDERTPDDGPAMDREQSDEQQTTELELDHGPDVDMSDINVPDDSLMLDDDGEAGEEDDDHEGPSDDMPQEEELGFSRRPFHPVNPLNLAPPPTASHLLPSPRHEGSPLKNVVLLSPTEPSPGMSPVVAGFGMSTGHGREGNMEYSPAEEGNMHESFEDGTEQAAGMDEDQVDIREQAEQDAAEHYGLSGENIEGQGDEQADSYDLPTAEELQESLGEQADDVGQTEQPEQGENPEPANFSLPSLREPNLSAEELALSSKDDEERGVAEEGGQPDAAGQSGGGGNDEDDGLDLLDGLDRQEEFSMDDAPLPSAKATVDGPDEGEVPAAEPEAEPKTAEEPPPAEAQAAEETATGEEARPSD